MNATLRLYDSSKNVLGDGSIKVKFDKKGHSKKYLQITTTLKKRLHGKIYYGLELVMFPDAIVGFTEAGETKASEGDVITVIIKQIKVK